MNIQIRLNDSNGDIMFSNINSADFDLVYPTKKESELIEYNSKKIRVGILKTAHGTVFALSRNKDYINSSRRFTSELKMAAQSLEFFSNTKSTIEGQINANTSRLLHNLISLNAHNIQEIFSLIPQENIANKVSGHVEFVEEIIQKNPKNFAMALLRIAKNNAAIKTEFSVFKRLFDASPELHERGHVVHKVLMNVLYMFFSDFTDKKSKVTIQSSTLRACFDYESIYVALYHLIENSAKYVRTETDVSIQINDTGGFIEVVFAMISTEIKAIEIEKIFEEGVSGIISIQTAKAGNGIGMHMARRLARLNGGDVKIKTHPETLTEHFGVPYQKNIFTLSLKKERSKTR